ncbi:flagellar hook protein FlgE [Pseudomonas sp. dw_358]|uniref:flagellar hook protein FlgE n=1 Tax=Pseudomonas sp. dw_358 TaxID=2720083 RepID=UPI001BD21D8F|nr:flagellar hook protein FlgE [Pseudomonas sp. dw_358]
MSFNIGLSGLSAAQKSLDVTGNNIANVATTGFKASRTEFADQYAASLAATAGKTTNGTGVTTAAVSQEFTQGTISSTGQALDMAINGSGFFVLSANGTKEYTRNGTFNTDKEGYITTTSGANVQGYNAVNGTVQTGSLTNLKIDSSNLSPKATSSIAETINLDSSDADPTVSVFDATNVNSYNYTFNTDTYDSQGNAHQLNQYFVKNSANNAWTMYTTVDGRNPADPTSTTPLANSVSFNSDGSLDTTALTAGAVTGGLTVNADKTFSLTNWVPATEASDGTWAANGANASTTGVKVDLLKATQYNASSATSAKTQDGYATGELSGLSVDSTGVLFANFTNGQSKTIGQVAMANFANVQGLAPAGGTDWKETYASGVPVIGTPATGTMGSLTSESLEESNVDLTSELVNLIKEQSNYQANAKTISTQSTIMQTLIQMT